MNDLRVLLVDDSGPFLESAARFLAAERGFRVVGYAHSGEEAVAKAQALAPDVVLMDLSMPGMGGLEATRLIKKRGNAPRVVVLTMHDTAQYRAAAVGLADGFVAKTDFGTCLVPMIRQLFEDTAKEHEDA